LTVKVVVDQSKCNLCGLCVKYCPAYVFAIEDGRIRADSEKCVECYACIPLCPRKAIAIESCE